MEGIGLCAGVVVATPFVFGGTALTEDELAMVGAGGNGVAVTDEMNGPIPLTDEELEVAAVSGVLPRFVWPFQYVPEQTSEKDLQ